MVAELLLDTTIRIEGGSLWPVFLVGFGGAIVGALVGSGGSTWLEAWKKASDGIAAARLIRMELLNNRNVVALALQNKLRNLPKLSDRAWKEHALRLAPLVGEIELSKLSREIALVDANQEHIEELAQLDEVEARGIKKYLNSWSEDLRKRGLELRSLEEKPRRKHVLRLLFAGRPATDDEIIAAFLPEIEEKAQETAES